jgi:hypothetical protein
MSAESLRFRLELERESDAIAGRLSAEQGNTIVFTGWLELISALEEARARATGSATDDDQEVPGRGSGGAGQLP